MTVNLITTRTSTSSSGRPKRGTGRRRRRKIRVEDVAFVVVISFSFVSVVYQTRHADDSSSSGLALFFNNSSFFGGNSIIHAKEDFVSHHNEQLLVNLINVYNNRNSSIIVGNNKNDNINIKIADSFVDEVQKCRPGGNSSLLFRPTTFATTTNTTSRRGSTKNSSSNHSRQIIIDNANIHSLPAHCWKLPLAPPRNIDIRGERHSGTNLIRSLIQDNTMGKYTNKIQKYGWKHGVYYPEDDVDGCRDVILVIARDAFSWILKMFNEPYNMIFEDGMTEFGPFLRGKYRSHKWEDLQYYYNRGVNCTTFPMEEARNVVDLRTVKYQNWLLSEDAPYIISTNNNTRNIVSKHPDLARSYIRYESLIELGQPAVMKDFFDRHCIPHLTPLKEVKQYKGEIDKNKRRNEIFQRGENAHYNVLSMYTIDELRFVLDNLDLDFEKQRLNYSYGYVEEYIQKRRNNETFYKGPPKLNEIIVSRRKDLAKKFKAGILLNEQKKIWGNLGRSNDRDRGGENLNPKMTNEQKKKIWEERHKRMEQMKKAVGRNTGG